MSALPGRKQRWPLATFLRPFGTWRRLDIHHFTGRFMRRSSSRQRGSECRLANWGSVPDENVASLALLHHIEKQTESFIPISDRGINIRPQSQPLGASFLSPSNMRFASLLLPIRA